MDRDERALLGAAARRRIEEHFSLQDAVSSYERLYEEVAAPQKAS
jgi:glycosyltransferase involved in cell wall biosynthesis